jgi:anti-anti-sigma factor
MECEDAGYGGLVVTISGDLDILGVGDVDDRLRDLLERPVTPVKVDLTEVTFIDSSGIAMLLKVANRFGPVRLVDPSPMVRQIIDVTGLTEILLTEGDS